MLTLVEGKSINRTDILEEWLKSLLKSFPQKNKAIYRFEIPLAPLDLLSWLRTQKNPVKMYWSNREHDLTVAAIGQAYGLTSKVSADIDTAHKKIKNFLIDGVKVYGGFCFDEQNYSAHWQDFGKTYFFIPRFEVIRRHNEYIFACNLQKKDLADLSKVWQELRDISFDTAHGGPIPKIFVRCDDPEFIPFMKELKKVIAALKAKKLNKVVLARETQLSFTENLDPLGLFSKLTIFTPDCYHFYFQPKEGTAFLGASPERLYRRKGKAIESEALAGTRRRGESPQKDQNLARDLLNSPKDLYEHKLVVQAIEKNLRILCRSSRSGKKPAVFQSMGGQHLVTHFEGELKKIDDPKILKTLHPTPAVAGTPTKKALQAIRKAEKFKRGFYAGPIGYFGEKETEFAVAIRSGLVAQNKLSIFAGAGIVKDSEPNKEWDEIENKLNVFLSLFG